MQKIMFNDRYGLTDAVLNGTKTMTRRVNKNLVLIGNTYSCEKPIITISNDKYYFFDSKGFCFGEGLLPYKIDEVVAVAQSYSVARPELYAEYLGQKAWINKMFVKPSMMPHQIQITGIKIERLQDITDEDCLREGIEKYLEKAGLRGVEYYDKHANEVYWIAGGDYDQSFSYCKKCATKIVNRLNKSKADDEYIVDGGWGSEDETAQFCERCGKPLHYSFIPFYLEDELAEIDVDNVIDQYLIDQLLGSKNRYKTIRELAKRAFASLIDKVSGKGMWKSNPYVFVYEFNLVK